MKQKVKISRTVTETIEVEMPYFYKHDLGTEESRYEIYGRVEGNFEVTIHERAYHNGHKCYEVETDYQISDCYFGEKYKSTREEFDAAKERALKFMSQIP